MTKESWLPTNPYNKKYAIHKHSAFGEGVNSTAKKIAERSDEICYNQDHYDDSKIFSSAQNFYHTKRKDCPKCWQELIKETEKAE